METKDFLSDSEMATFESKGSAITPDFLSDSEMDKFSTQRGNIDKTEPFLQRALGTGKRLFSRAWQDTFNQPLGGAYLRGPGRDFLKGTTSAILQETGMPEVASSALAEVGQPESLLSTFMGVKTPEVSMKKVFPYTSKESRVSFTKGIEKSLVRRRSALGRLYGSEIDKFAESNPTKMVDLSDAFDNVSKQIVAGDTKLKSVFESHPFLKQFVDTPSAASSITIREAQQIKNIVGEIVPEAVKKGFVKKPSLSGVNYFLENVGKSFTEQIPELKPLRKYFGTKAEAFKSAIAPIRGSRGPENIFGSNLVSQMFRGGGIPEKAQVGLKEFSPRLAKKVNKAKINENIFRGLRGATVSSMIYPFIPGALKRATLSETTK